MLRKLYNYRLLIFLFVFAVLEIIALALAPSWYDNTTFLNTLLFIAVSYLAISPFWGEHHHPIWGIMWSLLVMGPLSWFFGIIEVVLYWYLFSKKKRTSTSTSSTERVSEETSSPLPNSVHARIPILRIPIPWIRYSITDKYVTRISWFGKDDPEPFERIENWYISGNATRAITGVSVFGFRSKKPHADDYVVWHLLPAEFAVRLSSACMPKK